MYLLGIVERIMGLLRPHAKWNSAIWWWRNERSIDVVHMSDDGFALSSDGGVGLVFCLCLAYVLQYLLSCSRLLLIGGI